jgi:hypothetical protein
MPVNDVYDKIMRKLHSGRLFIIPSTFWNGEDQDINQIVRGSVWMCSLNLEEGHKYKI